MQRVIPVSSSFIELDVDTRLEDLASPPFDGAEPHILHCSKEVPIKPFVFRPPPGGVKVSPVSPFVCSSLFSKEDANGIAGSPPKRPIHGVFGFKPLFPKEDINDPAPVPAEDHVPPAPNAAGVKSNPFRGGLGFGAFTANEQQKVSCSVLSPSRSFSRTLKIGCASHTLLEQYGPFHACLRRYGHQVIRVHYTTASSCLVSFVDRKDAVQFGRHLMLIPNGVSLYLEQTNNSILDYAFDLGDDYHEHICSIAAQECPQHRPALTGNGVFLPFEMTNDRLDMFQVIIRTFQKQKERKIYHYTELQSQIVEIVLLHDRLQPNALLRAIQNVVRLSETLSV